jgi:dephospho-CoA kinase
LAGKYNTGNTKVANLLISRGAPVNAEGKVIRELIFKIDYRLIFNEIFLEPINTTPHKLPPQEQ